MSYLADWTTAGPYRGVTWITIIFTAGVVLTLILTLLAQKDAWRTYKAVKLDPTANTGMLVLAESTLIRSAARVAIQLAFLALGCVAIWIGVEQDRSHLYWYRIVFIVSFMGAEALLCLSAMNDLVAKHRLEEYIAERRERDHSKTPEGLG